MTECDDACAALAGRDVETRGGWGTGQPHRETSGKLGRDRAGKVSSPGAGSGRPCGEAVGVFTTSSSSFAVLSCAWPVRYKRCMGPSSPVPHPCIHLPLLPPSQSTSRSPTTHWYFPLNHGRRSNGYRRRYWRQRAQECLGRRSLCAFPLLLPIQYPPISDRYPPSVDLLRCIWRYPLRL